jgi:LmbE family N-acetylglucosaminyl deacetylase
VGAHSDDIEIGCGGLVLRLVKARRVAAVDWVVFSGSGARAKEARASARLFLRGAPRVQVRVLNFRDGFFPYDSAVKEAFERLKRTTRPDLILTHYRDDRHQDHRVLSDLTWNTFRDHAILEYEIPKYDGDLGTPSVFVPIDRATSLQKARHLMDAFGTQRDKHWFSAETFLSLLRVRGMECRSPTGFAEAFYSRKLLLNG